MEWSEGNYWWEIEDENGNEVCQLRGLDDVEFAKRNFALIIAAPDLLECLTEVFDDGLATNMKQWREKAQAAIAKATGVKP